jgi:hypothetical protein
MFSFELDDSTVISQIGDPSDPAYNPIFIDLDSTDTNPAPSAAVMLFVKLPAGLQSLRDPGGAAGGTLLTFVGASAARWQMTLPNDVNPLVPDQDGWGSALRVDIEDGQPTRFFVRSTTVFGEVPVDDRSVGINANGPIKAAE